MKTRKHKDGIKLHIINGYKVLFVKQNNNQLHIECVIRSGFYNESKRLSGINHLLEHMILEHYYLTKSKYIIATYSQFSMTASLIGNIPLFSINDYIYKDYNSLLQLNI